MNSNDIPDLSDINNQMLGGSDNDVIDVTDLDQAKPEKSKMSKKKKRQLIFAVVAIIIVVGVVVFAYTKKTQEPVTQAPELDAILNNPSANKPIGGAPPDQPSPQADTASPIGQPISIGQPVSAVPVSPIASPIGQPISIGQPVSAVPDVKPVTNATLDHLKEMEARLKEAENALLSKTAELEAIKSKQKKVDVIKKSSDNYVAEKPVAPKEKRKEMKTRDISMSESMVSVLMEDGLIYMNNGEYVEISVGANFPGYGKLTKVDKDAKTFETPNFIYHLKDYK